MKSLLLLFLLYLSVHSIAQQTLYSHEMAPFGSSWTLTYAQNSSPVDTNIQGANVTWDFTTIQPTSSSLTITIVDPAQTPYASSFTNSNYAYQEGPFLAYRYFNLSPTKMERVGSWTNSVGIRTYSDPQIEYVFPLTLGSISYDTWTNSTSTSGGSGTYNLECIGYGTLILPIGTFNDVLFVRSYLSESFYYYHTYFWYSSSSGIALANYIPQNSFVAELLVYATATSVPTSTETISSQPEWKYTNPVTSLLTVFLGDITGKGYSYKITNTLGQIVSAGTKEQQTSSLQIDMKDLEKGIYFVTLKSRDLPAKTIKVLKI